MCIRDSVYGGFVTVDASTPFGPYTITLPSPVTVPGAQFELMMNQSSPITIATPVGWIGGASGSYESTRVLTVATVGPHNRFYSDGANWNMLSVSGYNAAGDLTATRVNAGAFAINSANINTLFTPIASPSFTGKATVSGTLTTSNDVVINTGATTAARYGRVMSTDQYHAMILRGDINHTAPNYTVAGG